MIKKKVVRNEVDFSDIFSYAEKKFGVGWNPANDMFFGHSLTYKSHDKYSQGEPLEHIPEGVPYEELSTWHKGYYIINQFMIDNDLEDIWIDNN